MGDRDPSPPAEAPDRRNSMGEAGSGSGRPGMRVYDLNAGYYAPRYQSRWGPWNLSGSGSPPKRSRYPDEGDSLILKSDEEDEDYNEDEDEEDDTDDEDEDDTDDEDYDAEKEQVEEEEDLKEELVDLPLNAVEGSLEPALRVGVGFKNLGNTCYLNAVLQCLVHTYPLQRGLSMVKHDIYCFEYFCLLCQLRMLTHRTFSQPDEVAPVRIVANLKYFSPDFERFQQEDAHEFLQCMLNRLEMFTVHSDPFSGAPSENLVKQIFGGSLVSKLRCSNCNHISSMHEDLIDFSLDIDEVNTLEGALESFTKPEIIEGTTCENCNEIASMEKQFMVDTAPIIASFHLKRFKNDGTTVEKIRKHIDYPSTLNLRPYTMGESEHNDGLTYDLYAVIVHLGYSTNSGHYYCFVRSSPSVWHEFDDSTVIRASESHALSQEAYILFYARHEASWFFNGNVLESPCPPTISPNSVLGNCNQPGESDLSTESSLKFDYIVNSHEEDNVATCQTAFCGPQLVKSELFKEIGHVEFPELLPNNESDDKNEASLDDSSFNFDMLLNCEEKENRSWVADTIDSSLNCDMLDASINNTSKVVADKSDSVPDAEPNILTCQELVDIAQEKICSTSISNSAESSELPINPDTSPTKIPSTLASSSSRGDTKVEKQILRKRSAKKLLEDQTKRHFKVPKRTTDMHIPMTRSRGILACSDVTQIKQIRKVLSPNKKNKKGLVSLSEKSESCC